jgi:asparagine synthase (glutamine-hydrolysing)
MCGIAGLVDFNRESSLENLKEITDALFHRGPDGGDYLLSNTEQYQIGLGHRRLSIIDLSQLGTQPMTYKDLSMVYNGEVYNYQEIKEELKTLGYSFDSSSDSEVVLKSFHYWGIEAVNRFNGMFAIALFDSTQKKLHLIRDRAGVKPVYWYWERGLFLFASELKSFYKHPNFRKELNENAMALYLKYGYVPEPSSILKNVKKLEAGSYLSLDLNTKDIVHQTYWDIIDLYKRPKLKISEEEAVQTTQKLLTKACSYRMISDVPVGIFLSGGYDSSTVAAIIQSSRSDKVKTFTIGFEGNEKDESNEAKQIAKHIGTDHNEYFCTKESALKILEQLPYIFDEPFADSSAIPTILVSEYTREKVTVSLSADGGDEIFGGYSKYKNIMKYHNKIKNESLKSFINLSLKYIPVKSQFSRKLNLFNNVIQSNSSIEALGNYQQIFKDQEIKRIVKKGIKFTSTNFNLHNSSIQELSEFDKLLAIDFKTYQLDDILTKVDRATMSVSLEGREPLLDINLIDFVTQLDDNFKIRNGEQKYLLKKIAHSFIPKELLDRPKKGFDAPLVDLLGSSLDSLFDYYFSLEFIEKQQLFNYSEIKSILIKYRLGEISLFNQLWIILTFQRWYEYWFIKNA